jgi:hypothetical protein
MKKRISAIGIAIASAGLSAQAQGAFMHSETVVAWQPPAGNVGETDPGYDAFKHVVYVSDSTYYQMSVPGIVANGIADYTNLPKIVSSCGQERRQTVPIFEDVVRFPFEHGAPSAGSGGLSATPGPPVPEPGSLVLLAAGGIAMLRGRAR